MKLEKGDQVRWCLGFYKIWEQSDWTVHIHCHWRTVEKGQALVLVAWWDLSHTGSFRNQLLCVFYWLSLRGSWDKGIRIVVAGAQRQGPCGEESRHGLQHFASVIGLSLCFQFVYRHSHFSEVYWPERQALIFYSAFRDFIKIGEVGKNDGKFRKMVYSFQLFCVYFLITIFVVLFINLASIPVIKVRKQTCIYLPRASHIPISSKILFKGCLVFLRFGFSLMW